MVNVSDFENVPVDDLVENGWYLAQAVDVKEREDKPTWEIHWSITEDIGNKNEENVIGRQVTDFVAYGGWENDKDGGKFRKRYCKQLLVAMEASGDVGTEDIRGTEVAILVKAGKDLDGLPRSEIRRYEHPSNIGK
jgi:hypothetical protein